MTMSDDLRWVKTHCARMDHGGCALNVGVKGKKIQIGIMTVPGEDAPAIAELMVKAGIKGLLNYTPKPVNVPKEVYLEEYDMITSLEKVAFFVKTH